MYKKTNKSGIREVIDNVIVVYIDGIAEHFEAVRITNKGVIIGRIIETKFIPFGFIPKNGYKKIYNICKGK